MNKQEKLSVEEIEDINLAAELIQGAFRWANSPQGGDYWANVVSNLRLIVSENKDATKTDCHFCEHCMRCDCDKE